MKLIDRYNHTISNSLQQLNLHEDPPELFEPMRYILSLGGKRIRPVLTLAACELMGGKAADALSAALGVELFHNFSLIHDDIMDKAPMRRGMESVHQKWNTNIAILSGDAMLVKAYQYIGESPKTVLSDILKTFSATAMQVCIGQQYDMNFELKEDVSEDDYLEMIRLKTSVLLGCAMKIGALCGEAVSEDAELLYRFGEDIGISFQIQDDLLDAFGQVARTGKRTGGDILSDKKTLLMIHALQNDDKIRQWIGNSHADETKVEAVQRIFEDCGSRAFAEERMHQYYQSALDHLSKVGGDSQIKSELEQMAKFILNRES